MSDIERAVDAWLHEREGWALRAERLIFEMPGVHHTRIRKWLIAAAKVGYDAAIQGESRGTDQSNG
jgi:hypothetical protein